MTEVHDDWVGEALSDDALVGQLLLKLRHSDPSPPPPPPRPSNQSASVALRRLGWTVRQRRSKQVSRNKTEVRSSSSIRASPTTPLSWSGAATSASGGAADFFEESSVAAKPIDTARSKLKVVVLSNEASTVKRSRKKKTLAELKEEESFLLKERINLKNQLENLQVTIEKQMAENSRLKRIKFHLVLRQTPERVPFVDTKEVKSNLCQQIKAYTDPKNSDSPTTAAYHEVEPSLINNSFQIPDVATEHSFQLPDLNNLPVEDHSLPPFFTTDSDQMAV